MVSRSESACPPSLVITQLKLSLQAIQHEKREKKNLWIISSSNHASTHP